MAEIKENFARNFFRLYDSKIAGGVAAEISGMIFGGHKWNFSTKQIKMASLESLMEKMMPMPGIVSTFGLLNNEDKDIKVYIDKEIINEERMSFHPNTNEKTLFINTPDLLMYLESIGYPANVVEL